MSGFTDKGHLATYAYNDAQRLADRGAIYQYLKIESIELGSHPFREEGIVGLVSTFLDPSFTGPALDIGCGQGKYLPLLASQCKSVVAADLSAGMLADVPDGPWEKMIADVESMTFADGSFDVVLANHMLYHCPEIETAVAELRRVLRVDNGVLIATTNGNGNMAEAYELLASAASSVMGESAEPLQPADSRFTLETCAPIFVALMMNGRSGTASTGLFWKLPSTQSCTSRWPRKVKSASARCQGCFSQSKRNTGDRSP
jgi:SAM-dependent methyltransferase